MALELAAPGLDGTHEEAVAASLRATKLSFGLKALYGSGQILDSVANTVLTTFLFFYVTAVCGLSGSLTGLSLFLSLVIDAMADPLIGSLSDNTVSRLGRRHPFMIASILPLAIAFGFLFSIPNGLHGWPLFAYVTLVSTAVRIAWSVFGLPYAALGAELSDDYHERSSIVTWRQAFGIVAQMGCVALGFSLFLHGPKGLLDRAAYTPFGWTCAAIIAAGGATAAFGTFGARGRLHKTVRGAGHPIIRLVREIAEVLRNPSFRALGGGVVVYFIAQGTYLVLLLHALKFFWALPPDILQAVALVTQAGLLFGIPIMVLFGRFAEKRAVFVGAICFVCATEFFLPLLRIFGVLPASGPILNFVVVANAALLGVVSTAAVIAFQSAFADAADEHELLFGARREGLYYAALSLSVKAAVGVGALIAGFALDAIGFPSDIAAHPNVHIAAGTLRNLGLVYGPGAAVLTTVAIAILLGYRLDGKEHARIQREITKRRVSASGG
jgi:glycoside/pentoside/hexuronide:cation symporter, GPH family